MELRFVHADDIPLSPAYGRDTAYVAVHMYKGMPYRDYFEGAERIFQVNGGRPHWGKLHTMTAAELAPRYPLWEHFRAVRRRMDPGGLFSSPYLERLFGTA